MSPTENIEEILADIKEIISINRNYLVRISTDTMYDNIRPMLDTLLEDILQKEKEKTDEYVDNKLKNSSDDAPKIISENKDNIYNIQIKNEVNSSINTDVPIETSKIIDISEIAAKGPKLEIDKNNFDFLDMKLDYDADIILISNIGNGRLIGNARSNRDWLRIILEDIDTADTQQISFGVDTQRLDNIKDIGKIIIDTNGGTEEVNVNVSTRKNVDIKN